MGRRVPQCERAVGLGIVWGVMEFVEICVRVDSRPPPIDLVVVDKNERGANSTLRGDHQLALDRSIVTSHDFGKISTKNAQLQGLAATIARVVGHAPKNPEPNRGAQR